MSSAVPRLPISALRGVADEYGFRTRESRDRLFALLLGLDVTYIEAVQAIRKDKAPPQE